MGSVHLVNPLRDAYGGSEWRTLSLYRALRGRVDVHLWTEETPDPAIAREYPVERITATRAPKGGTLVIVGVYFAVGDWIRAAGPRRVVLCYNSRQPKKLDEVYAALFAQTEARVELVYASDALRATSKLEGIVEDSIIDVAAFRPMAPRARSGSFHVGRLSRDLPQKHHPSDPALYVRLALASCRVTVMGGTSLAERVAAEAEAAGLSGGTRAITLLPAGAMTPPAFLGTLDCFFYRIAPASFEAAGRVVTEAMAAELPVVCYRGGGYAEYIDHGRTGFLFDADDEAFAQITALARSPELATRVGSAARESMEERFSETRIEAILRTYLA